MQGKSDVVDSRSIDNVSSCIPEGERPRIGEATGVEIVLEGQLFAAPLQTRFGQVVPSMLAVSVLQTGVMRSPVGDGNILPQPAIPG